ncbi:MAG: SCO family protein [Deltaproteobacteria bacterium]|nr:SCO family protein [Deltaproteobacteria bacterium]
MKVTIPLLLLIALLLGRSQLLANNLPHQNYKNLGGEIRLKDQFNKNFNLNKNLGKIIVLFFGYTNCPDICPVTLATMKEVKQDLGDYSREVLFIFITLDPVRDTPKVLRRYLRNIDPEFIGLRGSESQIAQTAENYSIRYSVYDKKSVLDYKIEHTPFAYLLDQDAKVVKIFPFNSNKNIILAMIKKLLKANSSKNP